MKESAPHASARFGVWLVAAVVLSSACTGSVTRPAKIARAAAEAIPVDAPSTTEWPPCTLDGEPFKPEVLSVTGHPDAIACPSLSRSMYPTLDPSMEASDDARCAGGEAGLEACRVRGGMIIATIMRDQGGQLASR